jgi:hypothetical protein
MNGTRAINPPRALSSTDGKQWHDGTPVECPRKPDLAVVKIVLGTLEQDRVSKSLNSNFLEALSARLAQAFRI